MEKAIGRVEDWSDACLIPMDIRDFIKSLYLIRQKDIEITTEMGDFLKFAEQYFSVIDRYFKYP